MQLDIVVLSASIAAVAFFLFALGVSDFRRPTLPPAPQLRAAATMWAGVLSVCALLCLAGTAMILPV